MREFPSGLGWLVLTLVFVDELLAVAAAVVFGHDRGGWLLGAGLGVVVIAVWWLFASPRAPYGGPLVRPLVKLLVFGLAGLGLWAAGHSGWAIAFWAFSIVVNVLALHPSIATLVDEPAPREHS